MFSQLMGKFLVDKGVITADVLTDILAKQSAARVKLGTIAVADKLLTEEQAQEINNLQTQMDMRFGDICVDKGYLTEDQVGGLLKKQGNVYMKFVQLVTENTDLSVTDIEACVAEFQKSKGFSDAELEALKKDDIDAILPVFAFASKPYITDIIGLVLRNITRFVSTDFYIDRIKSVSSFEYKFLAGQKSEGDHNVYLAFGADEDIAGLSLIASRYSNSEISDVCGELADSVAEFANVNNGLFASELSEKGVDIDMLPPFAYANQSAEGRAYALPVYIEGKKVVIYVAVDSDVVMGTTPYEYSIDSKESTVVSDDCKGTVVVVDDSGMIRKMLRSILEEAGYAVVAEAGNGVEAVEAYKKYKPDIISLDITMPQMDGIEALEKIMEFDPKAYAIMVTAAGQQQKVIRAIKAGAAKFIMKPFIKDEVIKGFTK